MDDDAIGTDFGYDVEHIASNVPISTRRRSRGEEFSPDPYTDIVNLFVDVVRKISSIAVKVVLFGDRVDNSYCIGESIGDKLQSLNYFDLEFTAAINHNL
ncbi:hypothetical protein [Spirulina sp. 06S082]|uniref:hypothetical protein n=1 Tax=Spirulina sp. 06S082 TaxID=3110248 RepID=UPI002B216143|nr:hypothetical protein [Spirulina sp. 06S082]MEA5472053.1 hypothetical protein [Spirulina sp. 06S082]